MPSALRAPASALLYDSKPRKAKGRFNSPRGIAEWRIIQVIMNDTPGSKYRVHLPWQLPQNQSPRYSQMMMLKPDSQPNDQTCSDDTDVAQSASSSATWDRCRGKPSSRIAKNMQEHATHIHRSVRMTVSSTSTMTMPVPSCTTMCMSSVFIFVIMAIGLLSI